MQHESYAHASRLEHLSSLPSPPPLCLATYRSIALDNLHFIVVLLLHLLAIRRPLLLLLLLSVLCVHAGQQRP